MEIELNEIIKIGGPIIAIIVTYVRTIFWVKQLKRDSERMETIIVKMTDDILSQGLDIEKIKTEENMKDRFQSELISSILSPIIKSNNEQMKDFVDTRVVLINKEIEALKMDSQLFKSDVKSFFKNMKEENKEQIDRLIKVLEK